MRVQNRGEVCLYIFFDKELPWNFLNWKWGLIVGLECNVEEIPNHVPHSMLVLPFTWFYRRNNFIETSGAWILLSIALSFMAKYLKFVQNTLNVYQFLVFNETLGYLLLLYPMSLLMILNNKLSLIKLGNLGFQHLT